MAENRVKLAENSKLALYAEILGPTFSLVFVELNGNAESTIVNIDNNPDQTMHFDDIRLKLVYQELQGKVPGLTLLDVTGLFTRATRNYAVEQLQTIRNSA